MNRRLILALSLSLLSASTPAPAAMVEFTPFAGYTTVNMTHVNEGIKELKTFVEFIGLLSGPTVYYFRNENTMTSGWVAGGELLTDRLSSVKGLSLGLRGQYLQTEMAQLTTWDELAFGPTPANLAYELSGNLTSVMLGGRYKLLETEGGLTLSLGAFAGLGYAELHNSMGLLKINNLFHGQGFVADSDLKLDWKIPGHNWLSLSAMGGYRYASLGQLYDETSSPYMSPYSTLKNSSFGGGPVNIHGNGVDVDFSGLTAGGSFSVAF